MAPQSEQRPAYRREEVRKDDRRRYDDDHRGDGDGRQPAMLPVAPIRLQPARPWRRPAPRTTRRRRCSRGCWLPAAAARAWSTD